MSSPGSHSEQEPLLTKHGDEESQPNRSEGYGTTKARAQGVALGGQEVVTNSSGASTDDATTSTKRVPTTQPQDEDPALLKARRTVQRMLPILLIAVQSLPLRVYLLQCSPCDSVSLLPLIDPSWLPIMPSLEQNSAP